MSARTILGAGAAGANAPSPVIGAPSNRQSRAPGLTGGGPPPSHCPHEWRYARCAEIRGEYVVECKCRLCHQTTLL